MTIPDEPDWDNGLSYFVAVYDEEKRFCHAILLPIDQANELLDLIGQKLIEMKNDEVILRDIFSLFF